MKKILGKEVEIAPAAEPITLIAAPLDAMASRYALIKAQYPDSITLFHVGDFYEAYSADAVVIATCLGLARTVRHLVPMAAFPHHQLDIYVAKLVSDGFRVVVCEPTKE
jgi:DNA mismatch repair protein MutS